METKVKPKIVQIADDLNAQIERISDKMGNIVDSLSQLYETNLDSITTDELNDDISSLKDDIKRMWMTYKLLQSNAN